MIDAVAERSVAPTTGFGRFWFGEGVSLLGTATTSVLLPLLAVVTLHAGPVAMGTITAATWSPWVLIGLPAGVLVDRLPPKRVMIVADLAAAGALGSVPLAAAAGVLTIAHLIAAAFAVGGASVFFRTAYVLLVPRLVPDRALDGANARLLGTDAAAQVAGPGLGGALVATVSAAAGLVVDALSYLVSAACLLGVRPGPRDDSRPPVPTGRGVRDGLSAVFGDSNLRSLTLVGSGSNFGLTGIDTLLVLYLSRTLHLSGGQIGIVVMLGAAGGVPGAAVAGRLARGVGSGRCSTALLLAAGLAALAVAVPVRKEQVAVTVIAFAALSAAVVAGNVIRAGWRQRYVPPQLLGRVVTSSQLLNYGTMPLAGVCAGLLADRVGVRAAMLVLAAVHAASCSAILATRLGRSIELPLP